MTTILMDAPKVRKVLSSKPISIQAAHDLLSRFLQKEREDGVLLGGFNEVLTRLEAVCHSLTTTSSETTQKSIKTERISNKAAKKRKRRSEESSRSSGSKKIKTK